MFSSTKEISIASGFEFATQPLFAALQAAGLKPRMIREEFVQPEGTTVATCILVPRAKAAQARIFASAWNAALAAREAVGPHTLLANVSTYEL